MELIDNLGKQFKDFAELQAYSNAQYATIIDLSKKLNQLEADKKHLETLLFQATNANNTEAFLAGPLLETSDDETICRIQLKVLADKSIQGTELSLEETKRVEIYSKLLTNIKNGNKKTGSSASKLETGSLLTLLENESFQDGK